MKKKSVSLASIEKILSRFEKNREIKLNEVKLNAFLKYRTSANFYRNSQILRKKMFIS